MNKTFLITLVFLSGAAFGNAHRHDVYVVETVSPQPSVLVDLNSPVVVQTAPPALIQEQISPCPGPSYALVHGSWVWEGRWVWKRHQWVLKPYPNSVWEPAHWHWSEHHHGYVWEPGRWR